MTTTPAGTTGLFIHGATGRMGRAVTGLAVETDGVTLRGAIELRDGRAGDGRGDDIPVFGRLPDAINSGDVVIDFSRRGALEPLLGCLTGSGLPLVCGTTGIEEVERDMLLAYSKESPVFYDENMSYGIAVMKDLLRVAAEMLGDVMDVEIVESHHRMKHDVPSGTALALARVLEETGRAASDAEDRIPIHSIRAGGIAGEHRVLFASEEEVVELSHRALSREVFARGAIRAARFVSGRERGFFDMRHLLENRNE